MESFSTVPSSWHLSSSSQFPPFPFPRADTPMFGVSSPTVLVYVENPAHETGGQQHRKELDDDRAPRLCLTGPFTPKPAAALSSPSPFTSSPLLRLAAALNISPRATGPTTSVCPSRPRGSSPTSFSSSALADVPPAADHAVPVPCRPATTRAASTSARLEDLYELQRVIGQGAYGVVWYTLSYPPLARSYPTIDR